MFTALASSKRLRYQLSVDSSLPAAVVTDRTRLQQILCNVIGMYKRNRDGWPTSSLKRSTCLCLAPAAGNAVKFTTRGGVNVSVGFAPKGVGDLDRLIRSRQPIEKETSDTVALTKKQIYHACGRAPPTRLSVPWSSARAFAAWVHAIVLSSSPATTAAALSLLDPRYTCS